MEINVEIMNGGEHILELDQTDTYGDLLRALDINPEAAVVIVNGRPQPEEKEITSTEVKIMRTISGG